MICRPQNIKFPFSKLNHTPEITQTYREVKTNNNIVSTHPPKTAIFIQDNYLAIPLITSHNIVSEDSNPTELIKDIIYQNNYSNEILTTMSQQLNRIEGTQNTQHKDIKTTITSTSTVESTPFFIPQELAPDVNLGYNSKLVSQLGEKLTELKINTLNQNSDTESNSSSSDNEESKISQLQDQFTNTQTHNEINKLRYQGGNTASTSRPQTLNYYPRPTFPDVQYEDKNLTSRSQQFLY